MEENAEQMSEIVLEAPKKAPSRSKKTAKKAEKAPETFAEGGIVPHKEGEIALFGFENGPEAVIPLSESPEKLEKVAEMVIGTRNEGISEEEKAELAQKAAESPSGVAAEPDKGDLRAELLKILAVKKGKRDVPTLVWFHSDYARDRRAVIVDMNRNLLDDAWRRYREMTGGRDAELFLATVYDICKLEIPRMYRAIGVLELD